MRHTGKRARAIAWSAALTALLTFGVPAIAHAEDGVAVSHDGVTWGSNLDQPLFDESIRWVPGDSRMARFYVRNDTDDTARMDVDLIATNVDELLDTGELDVEVRFAEGPWQGAGQARSLRLSSQQVGGRASGPVDVRVSFRADATNVSELLAFQMNLRVTLTETEAAPPGPPAPPAQNRTGGLTLPITGSQIHPMVVASGVAAFTLGALLVTRRRREHGEVRDDACR